MLTYRVYSRLSEGKFSVIGKVHMIIPTIVLVNI